MSKGVLGVDENKSTCGGCNGEVKEGEKAMQCDACNRWTHNSCGGMPEDLYKVLVKYGNKTTGTKWFCKNCEIHFGKLKVEIRIMAEKQTAMEMRQFETENGLARMKSEVTELRKEIADFVKERKLVEENSNITVDGKFDELKEELTEIKKTYSSVVGGTVTMGDGSGGTGSNTAGLPARVIQVEVSEVMEREKRKNNLVIFGIEETNDEIATRAKVTEIISALGLENEKIKYFGRVGRLVAGARARIVRVVCEDAETKRKCLKAANKLKTMEGFNNVYISLDLTKTQQQLDKKLRDKLRELRVTHKDAKINNGEIVNFVNGNRTVLYSQVV